MFKENVHKTFYFYYLSLHQLTINLFNFIIYFIKKQILIIKVGMLMFKFIILLFFFSFK